MDSRPCADCENVEPCDLLERCIKHDPVPNGHDEYTKLGIPDGTHIEPCPVCAADAELWQYMAKPDAPAQKVVCCGHSDDIGPHDALAGGGCPLYMPPLSFYRPTIREAVKHWNEYAKALGTLRRSNGWKRARVLRSSTDGSGVAPTVEPAATEGKCGHCGMKVQLRWMHERDDNRCADMAQVAHVSGVRAVAPTSWDKWLKADHIKLHAGEMTAQELRTVQAVVRAMLAESAAGVEAPVTRQAIHDEIVRLTGHEFYSGPLHGKDDSGVSVPPVSASDKE